MSVILTWWTIIKHLRDYAKLQPELNGVDIRAGAKKPKDPYPCVEILWDEEAGVDLYRPAKGSIGLWIDTWIRSDSADPGAAYDDLSDLQDRFCVVLLRWTDILLEEKSISVNLKLRKAVSDGDSMRPLAGSRLDIEIEWRK